MKFTLDHIHSDYFKLSTKTDSATEIVMFLTSSGDIIDEVYVGDGVYHSVDDDLNFICLFVGSEPRSVAQIMREASNKFDDLYSEYLQEAENEMRYVSDNSSVYVSDRI